MGSSSDGSPENSNLPISRPSEATDVDPREAFGNTTPSEPTYISEISCEAPRRMASVAESNTFTTTGVSLIPFLLLAGLLCYVLYRQFPRRKRRGSVTELQEIVVEYPERHTRREQIRY